MQISAITGFSPAVASVISAQQAAVQNQIAYAVQAKVAESVQQQGETVIRLIDAAVGKNKTPGSGENFDATA
ncbi:MAG: hypothetical protein QGG36_26825 [Pirellulaceae bacterium]|nr:hypothetical protein [Pirellulaceae bacterium]